MSNSFTTGGEKNTPADFYELALDGSLDEIADAIKAGADVNAKECDGITPLHAAVRVNKNPAVTVALIKAGADVHAKDEDDWTSLHFAADGNPNPAIIAALIDAGADVNAKTVDGRTPLHFAANDNVYREVLSALINTGAYARDMPDFAAHEKQTLEVIAALIKAGADINAKDDNDATPLTVAIKTKNTAVEKTLRDAGAK